MLGLIQNELLIIIGRWRSYIGFIGISILMPLILWGFSVGGEELHQDYAKELGGTFMVVGSIINSFLATYVIMNTLWIHIPFLVTLAAGDSVAADGANGIFRITLTRSVSRFKILVSKLLASYIYTATLLIFCAFWSLGIGSFVLGTGDLIVIDNGILILDESQAWVRMAFSFSLAIFVMCMVATLCFMFSTMVSNAVGPIIGTMFLIIIGYMIIGIPLEIFEKIEPYIFVKYFNVWWDAFKDPIPWGEIGKKLGILGIYLVACFGIATYVFLKKDIKS
ncbi:MAG: ABC transporter permease subunit [Candidatus Marinimicrobia bacterium]|mgnify:FL=1|jgi:ABC-2 type transport system permease protein|nr:ABC transporter permease subunit [Candidatus Neomarinimicrobiota bacterium]|tara:strand:+ start:3002 stop:3838 length:837 start_codon:yes stop_codon:yes gene_type:complete